METSPSSNDVVAVPHLTPSSKRDVRDDADRPSRLELVSHLAVAPRNPVSLLFVHGVNVGAWVWEDGFLGHFAKAGFDAHALSLRGHGRSWGADLLREWRLADYVHDLEEAIGRIGGPIVLVGHSLGGAVVQKFIQRGGRAAGMALMAAVPPWGLAPSAFRTAATDPRMFAALMEMSSGRLPTVDADLVRRILFTAGITDAELERFLSRVGRESALIARELQGWPPLAPLPWLSPEVFVLGGGADTLIPSDEVWRTGLYYGVQSWIVPGGGHMLMLGPRWKDAANRLEGWLRSRFPHRP